MNGRRGFTLIEMLIVIIIIVIIAGASVAMMTTFFRGQGVRQATMLVTQVVAQAKARASEKHRTQFVVFSFPTPNPPLVKREFVSGYMEIHEDTNMNGIYDGDSSPETENDIDKPVADSLVEFPRFVHFRFAPSWMGVSPSGYITYDGAFKEMQASTFDAIMNGNSPTANGDIIIETKGEAYVVCLDLDRAGGKVRRWFFLNEAPQ